MNSPESSTARAPVKSTFACIRCSERKVGCNKQCPCSACIRHNVQCIFRPPKPSRKKRNFVEEKAMRERLKRYEALLREKGIDTDQITTIPAVEHRQSTRFEVRREPVSQFHTPASIAPERQATIFKPQLLHGQRGTKLVDNSLWSRVVEETDDTEDALEEDSANDASDEETFHDDFAYVLGTEISITARLHPPPKLIHQLWETFVANVNPLTKLVHIPTLQTAIGKAIANVEHIPKGFEALMFSIYSMAVLSLTEGECNNMLGESRANLLPRYVAATKAALARVKFMSSTSIVVMQALMLHILSIRDSYEARAVWSLTGLAIRIAEGMGMRIDGTLLGLSPFESEIRRRIWWQLKMHDFRAAELTGQAKFRDFELDETTPKKPSNINDSDLYPAMKQAAAESTRPTEMIWCVLRSELATFASKQRAKLQKLGKVGFTSEEYAAIDDLKMKDDFIMVIEDMIETKFLRFCDPSDPLQLLTLLGGRCAIDLIRFIAHHPRRWTHPGQVSATEQRFVWNVVLRILERYSMLQSSPQLRGFAWNMPYFIQWHAVIHVLDTLRTNPLHLDAVRAWRLIDTMYEINSEILLSTNRPIFVAVGNLCLKAFYAHVDAMATEQGGVSDPPCYIIKLQEQRQAAKDRRDAILIRNREQDTSGGEKLSEPTDTDAILPEASPRLAEALGNTQSQQYLAAKPPVNLIQGGTHTEDDAFWLSDAQDDILFADGAADMMSLDMDTILAQDSWFDNTNPEVMDWEQWDAWLSNVDLTRPTGGAGFG